MKKEDSHLILFYFSIHTEHRNKRRHFVPFSNSEKSISGLGN